MKIPGDVLASIERCAWCRALLVPGGQALIAGASFSRWSERFHALRGRVVHLRTGRLSRLLAAVVPLAGTPAHAAGYDALFVLCSQGCQHSLDDAIRDGIVGVEERDVSPDGGRSADGIDRHRVLSKRTRDQGNGDAGGPEN